MTFSPRRLVLLCGIAPTVAVALLSLARPAAFSHLEYGVYDRLTRAISAHPPGGSVAIVDVDERSLAAIGQWPWPRDTVATLLSKIRQLGAPTIGVDVIFAESDGRGGEDGHADAALARTLREGRVVLGYAMRFDGEPDARHLYAAAARPLDRAGRCRRRTSLSRHRRHLQPAGADGRGRRPGVPERGARLRRHPAPRAAAGRISATTRIPAWRWPRWRR